MGTGEVPDLSRSFAYLPKILNGGLAGVVGVTCVFPIDLVKTRLQNQRISANGKTQYRGILDCAKQTWQNGGRTPFAKLRGMYCGSGVNVLLITPEKAIKLVANDCFRYYLGASNQKHLSTFKGMVAGGGAGLCQVIVTTPMELLKIQMQNAGRTIAMDLWEEKGILGFYKGLGPTIARDVSFSVMYFPLFAYLDSLGPRSSDGSGGAAFYSSLCAGVVSGACSSFAVTPLDVIKTRMQLISRDDYEIAYRNVFDAFTKILRYEGPRALFNGAVCRMMVMAPLFGIAQMVYHIGVAEIFLGVSWKALH